MELVKKVMNFPHDLVKEIEKFQKENYINNFTAAVIELIRRSLKEA